MKDDALEDYATLRAPEIIASEIMNDFESALEQFATIAEALNLKLWPFLLTKI